MRLLRQMTRLNLILQGVVVGHPNQFSSAVIKVNDQADRYRVGWRILPRPAYQLAEVYLGSGSVLRQSNGATRELQFKGLENGLDQSIIPPVTTNSLPLNVRPRRLCPVRNRML